MGVDDIHNTIQIDDRITTSGQPNEEQFRAAKQAGYEVVINLAPDGLETTLPQQKQLLEAIGLEYHHFPVEWTAPAIAQYRAFANTMKAVAGQRTLIHCQANYRVTVFFALFAQEHLGWSQPQADALIDRIWTAHPDFQMNEIWNTFIVTIRSQFNRASVTSNANC